MTVPRHPPDSPPRAVEAAAELTSRVMESLRTSRPAFHTEADFQHAFAWESHVLRPEMKVRLERRLSAQTNDRLDLLFAADGLTIAVELKYPVTGLDATVDDEPFVLRKQGAEDRMRFGYIWDIVRLERLVSAGVADVGVAVLLTNVVQLWEPPKPNKRVAADTEFRLYEGRELAQRLAWTGDAVWWHKEKVPEAVELAGRYRVAWAPYSIVPGTGRGEFRWTKAVVAATPAGEALFEPTA